jgi:hypothetical protein
VYNIKLNCKWIVFISLKRIFHRNLKSSASLEKKTKEDGRGKKYTGRKIEKMTKLNVLQTFYFNLV